MKRIFLFVVFWIVIGFALFSVPAKITLEDAYGDYQLTFKGDWVEEYELNSEADIQAGSEDAQRYCLVIIESKDDFDEDLTLDEYYEIIANNMSSTVKGLKIVYEEKCTLNDMKGVTYKFSGTVDTLRVSYNITFVESDTDFIQIIFYCLSTGYEKYRSEFISIRNTFVKVEY